MHIWGKVDSGCLQDKKRQLEIVNICGVKMQAAQISAEVFSCTADVSHIVNYSKYQARLAFVHKNKCHELVGCCT